MTPLEARRALRARVAKIFPVAGCSDGSCVYGPAGGAQTNGGCICLQGIPAELRRLAQRLLIVAVSILEETP